MGLSISPCKWIQYIGFVMEKLPHPQNYIAIMDDLLVHSKRKDHMDRITEMLKALITHGLKLSPKKCQFFMKELTYMGNIFKITCKGITISPIKTRVEAILKTPAPKTPKQCKSFCGVVNYLSIFCPHLQKWLGPIYDLTRKGHPFCWTEMHQESFDTIKKQMASAPVLSLPDGHRRYCLYSDTSKTHTGSALWQFQFGKPRLIGYASKSLPQACANYSITELEMTALLYNMNMWKYYLGRNDFDATVDHAAIPHIMKSKNLPATNRIIRLLEALSYFTFHLYYVKGKDMILCDFLSRIQVDDGDPLDLIPITYNVLAILQDAYQCIADRYCIVTRSQRAKAGLPAPPPVHGATKGVNPNLKPETQARRQQQTPPRRLLHNSPTTTPRASPMVPSPHTVERTPDRSRDPPQTTPASSKSQTPFSTPLSSTRSHLLRKERIAGSSIQSPPKLNFDPEPVDTGEPSAIKTWTSQAVVPASSVPGTLQRKLPLNIQDIEPTHDLDPELEIPFHETSVEAMFTPPDIKDFSLPPTLQQYTKNQNFIAQTMPRQTEIERLLKQLNRKVLRETRFPSSLKDMEAAYNNSAAFRDVYHYLRYNKLPPNRKLSVRIQSIAQDYFLLGCLLFKHQHNRDKESTPVLCIPPSKIDTLLDYYHSTIIGGHQGITKTLQTLSSRFYCPRLADFIRAYIVGCHICQLFKNSPRFNNRFQQRYYDISTPALTHISMDIKYMPTSSKQYKFLLVLLCEVSNFIVTHPMKQISATHVCEILVDYFIAYFSTPLRLICDQDPAFISSLCQYCFQQYGIKLVTVSPTNHKSLLAKHGIKSLSNLIMKHLSGFGRNWHIFAKPCMIAYNSYSTPNLAGLSPFELALGRKANMIPMLEVTPSIPCHWHISANQENARQKIELFEANAKKIQRQEI